MNVKLFGITAQYIYFEYNISQTFQLQNVGDPLSGHELCLFFGAEKDFVDEKNLVWAKRKFCFGQKKFLLGKKN